MTKVTIDKALLEQVHRALQTEQEIYCENDPEDGAPEYLNEAVRYLQAALAEPAVGPVAKAMTAHRAAYFMERFKKEEKLLGPNEQAAVDFVIDMLTATHTSPPPSADVPMLTGEEFEAIRKTCAYQFAEACRSGTTKAKTIMQATEAAVRQKAGL